MGERFDPSTWLKRVLPKGFEKHGLLADDLTIKKRYLKALVQATAATGKEISAQAYETVEFYTQKEEALKASGVRAFKQEALNGQALLTQRIKNFLVYTEVQEQKKRHKGRMYRWLPSSAAEPDPEHGLLYGKVFREGDGHIMPGERWGCQCGIEWLDDEDMTPSEKAQSVKIDFRKNNLLPALNQKDLETVGGGDRKPVFLRRTLRRNKKEHDELRRKDYDVLTGSSLYQPIMQPLRDIKQTDYWHFIGSVDQGERYSFTLLDCNPKKAKLEIVHVLKMNKRGFKKFMKRYKK